MWMCRPSGSAASYDPCVDDETAKYLNTKAVQAALHVDTGASIGRVWSDCSGEVDYSREDLLASMLPVYRKLLALDGDDALHVFVFSGDVDGIVPVVHGTGCGMAGSGEGFDADASPSQSPPAPAARPMARGPHRETRSPHRRSVPA